MLLASRDIIVNNMNMTDISTCAFFKTYSKPLKTFMTGTLIERERTLMAASLIYNTDTYILLITHP